MGIGFEDIYQHQFNSLYQVVKELIGNSTISKPDENEEEAKESKSCGKKQSRSGCPGEVGRV